MSAASDEATDAETGNRAGKRPGWAQARKHHMAVCKPFAVGDNARSYTLRREYKVTSRAWDEQRSLIEWADNQEQDVVTGFFIDAKSLSQLLFMVRGELDAAGD